MKLFAVILASVAALAATVQAYLIWNSTNSDKDGAFAFDFSYRASACRTLVRASARLGRLSEGADGILASAANAAAAEAGLSEAGDETGSDLEAEALRQARAEYARHVDGELSSVLEFVDGDYIYFSQDELSQLGYDIWRSFPYEHGFYTSYSSLIYPQDRDDAEFAALLESVRRAGAQHDSIKEVCTPILLDRSS